MRKNVIILLTLLFCFLPVFGQEVAESIQIGYCCGENGSQGDITSSNAKQVSAAIPKIAQSGAGDDFIHQHAMRTANSAWGDLIDWNGYNFEYSCTLDIDQKWKKNDLDILVFINQYDADDPSKCFVENARKLAFPYSTLVKNLYDNVIEPDITIKDGLITVDAPYQIEGIWSLSGNRVGARELESGAYIVKVAGEGREFVRKILVH